MADANPGSITGQRAIIEGNPVLVVIDIQGGASSDASADHDAPPSALPCAQVTRSYCR